MAAKQPRGDEPQFSPELKNAISANRFGCFVDRPSLKAADVAVLKRLLKSGRSDPAIDRKRAVVALAESDSSQESTDILAGIAGDGRETARVRATAARSIALMPREAAEAALESLVQSNDRNVRIASAKALARIATPAALASLDRAKRHLDPVLQRQLALAQSAIRLRNPDAAAGKNPILEELGMKWTVFEAVALDAEEARKRLAGISDPPFGVEPDLERAYEMNCDARPHTLFLDKSVVKKPELKRGSQGLIAGFVALQEPETAYLTVRFLVTVLPAPDGAQVAVVKMDGEIAYAGSLSERDGAIAVSAKEVRPGSAATDVEGEFRNGKLTLRLRCWRDFPRRKTVTRPIPR